MLLYSVLNIYRISVTLSLTPFRVAVRPEKTLSRLSVIELTNTLILLPSEDKPLLFHTFISSRLFASG